MRTTPKILASTILAVTLAGCNVGGHSRTVAVVPLDLSAPSTCEHAGITTEATRQHLNVYWNGPGYPNQVEDQVALVDRATRQKSYGLIVSPANRFAVNVAIRHALQSKIPVVILGASVPLQPSPGLSFVTSDFHQASEQLALDLVQKLPPTAEIMIVGFNPLFPGKVETANLFMSALQHHAPGIRVFKQEPNGSSFGQTQLATEQAVLDHPNLSAIVSLDVTSTNAVLAAVSNTRRQKKILLVGYDHTPNLLHSLRSGQIEALIVQDMPRMGEIAIRQIVAQRHHQNVQPLITVPGKLVLASNVDNDDVQQMLRMDWRPAS